MSPSAGRRKMKTTIHLILPMMILMLNCRFRVVLSEMNAEMTSVSAKLPPGKFNGKEITVLAYNFPPMFTYKRLKDGNYTFSGLMFDQIEDVGKYFNMSLKYVVLDPVEIRKYGLWGAVLKPLDKKDVDIVPFLFYQDLDSLEHMELVFPFWIDPIILLQPYPDEQSHLAVTIRPFQLPVWLCFWATTAVFVLVSSFIVKNRMDISDSNTAQQSFGKAIYNQLDYVMRHFTNQGSSGTHSRTRTYFKLLTGIWLLSMVVLINGYLGVLTSFLTVPKLKPIAQTMKDVAESPELRVTVEKNGKYANIFLGATEGYEKILGDQLRQDPSLLVSDAFGALENVVHHKGAYPSLTAWINYFLKEDTKNNGKCRMTTSPDLRSYPSMAIQWGLPIGSPYAEHISGLSHLFWAVGIMSNIKNTLQPTSQCRVDRPLETKTRTLTFIDLSAAFFILGVGISISFFVFGLEILMDCIFNWAKSRIDHSTAGHSEALVAEGK